MEDPTLDPRIEPLLDLIANRSYAHLITIAREKGLGVYVTTLDNLPHPEVEFKWKEAVAQVLVDLLDAAGMYTLPRAA